jgi:hypothetical protein
LAGFEVTIEGRGSVGNVFEFLGVEFQGKNIRPAHKARKKLLDPQKSVKANFLRHASC